MANRLKGIRNHRGAWEVRWRGSDGRGRTKRFPLDTPQDALIKFRKKEIAKVTLAGPVEPRGTFEYERTQFLAGLKKGSSRWRDFTSQLAGWETHLKGKRLQAVTTAQINDVLTQWKIDGKANSTLMRQRSALMSLFAERAPDVNPVKGSITFTIAKPRPRAINLDIIARIFAKAPHCTTKARQMMIFYFGMRPSEIMRLRKDDIVLTGDQPFVFARSADESTDDSDGKGTNDRILPVCEGPQLEAVTMFVALNAYGKYSTAAARSSFLRWARAAGLPDEELIEGQSRLGRNRYRIRPYDLRHTFATELRRSGSDLADVQATLGHRQASTTERYAPKQDAKIAEAVSRSAIHTVPINLLSQLDKLSTEEKAALAARLLGQSAA